MNATNSYSRKIKSGIMMSFMVFCTLFALVPLFSILIHIGVSGLPNLNLSFITNLPAPVGAPGGGMANGLLGTILLVSIASGIGIPVGVLTAIYLSEYQREGAFSSFISFIVDSLLGTPSIVIGIFVYLVIVVPMKSFSALAGGTALGIMMIPIIIRGTENMLLSVPYSLREAGYALGIRKWKVIVSVVLPTAMKGIVTTIMLSVARVAGETAPLLFTAFGSLYWGKSLTGPMPSLPVMIYNYAISPFAEWQNQAWAGALLLILMVLSISILARVLTRTRTS